ncbi:MAG TPA: sialidase family protein [Ktedonobacteraceae bacterium]|nr:sialidase family protein [Ktedonobacteraceae bacterium]
MRMYLAMEKELLVLSQQKSAWQAERQLVGMRPTCVAVDPFKPEHVYCGTFGRGLWGSEDAGRSWKPIGDAGSATGLTGPGITQAQITAVAVSPTEQAGGYGVAYAGTEPSAMFRSEDGGNTWYEQKTLLELPSAPTWSFPPRPHTSHVRWITPDPLVAGRLFAAIEAGALVRSLDGGEHWEDRTPDSPYDTHTLMMHPLAPNRLYSAAGDGFMSPRRGYNESVDGGESWQHPDEGLEHHYLWGVAVDPADPETILISASSNPFSAHNPNPAGAEAALAHHGRQMPRWATANQTGQAPPRMNWQDNGGAESVLYRKTRGTNWQRVSMGLPEAQGTVVPVVASHKAEPGVFYALSNKGLYRSADAGQSWESLLADWNPDFLHQHQQSLVISEA